jgi:hypothetical protein
VQLGVRHTELSEVDGQCALNESLILHVNNASVQHAPSRDLHRLSIIFRDKSPINPLFFVIQIRMSRTELGSH